MRLHRLIVGSAILALVAPSATLAQSADDLRAQINTLLQQIQTVQATIGTSPAASTPARLPVSTSTSAAACPKFTRTLARGTRGDDVLALQRFLGTEGLLAGDSQTGFFGALTEDAVQRWQATYKIVSSGSPATTGWGLLGPRTARLIDLNCTARTQAIVTSGDPVRTGPEMCPAAPRPSTICAGSWRAVPGESGCTAYWQCVVSLAATSTPAITTSTQISCPVNPRPSTQCSGSWHAATDARGCTASWQCVISPETPTLVAPTISIISPVAGQSYGYSLDVRWTISTIPSNSRLALQLVGNTGTVVISKTVDPAAASANFDIGPGSYCNESFSDALGPCSMYLNKDTSYHIQAWLYTPANACIGFCAPGSPSQTTLTSADSGSFRIAVPQTSI